MESVTPFSVTQPGTQVTVAYELDPERVGLPCAAGDGATDVPCTYEVGLTVRSTEDPANALKQETLRMEEGSIQNARLEVTLDPGTYEVTKRVRSVTSGRPAVVAHARALRQRLEAAASQALSAPYGFLEQEDLESFYGQFAPEQGATSVTVPVLRGCFNVEAPVARCVDPCEDLPSFEQVLVDRWGPGSPHELAGGTPFPDRAADYFWRDGRRLYPLISPRFPRGEGAFDALIEHMISEGGFACQELWGCWQSIVATYGMLATTDGSADPAKLNEDFDLLGAFLACAKARPESFASRPYRPGGYLERAYKFVRTPSRPSDPVDQLRFDTCEAEAAAAASDATSGVEEPGAELTEVEAFYNCYEFGSATFADLPTAGGETLDVPAACQNLAAPSSTADTTAMANYRAQLEQCASGFAEQATAGCGTACEARRIEFVLRLAREYRKQGQGILLAGLDAYCAADGAVGIEQIFCQADALVEACKRGCSLSVNKDEEGRIVSIGTEEEIEAVKASMTYKPVVRLPDASGQCPTEGGPFEQVVRESGEASPGLAIEAARRLNALLEEARGKAEPNDLPSISSSDVVAEIESMCQGVCADSIRSRTQGFRANESASFIAEGCVLVYLNGGSEIEGGLAERSELCQLCTSEGCGAACLRWERPEMPEVPDLTIRQPTCERESATYVQRQLEGAVADQIDGLVEAFEADYERTCTADVDDRLTVSYTLGIHHYTLFYYDRAGNLARTVAPKGVETTAPSRAVHPAHEFVSANAYNSLGQRVRRETPDEGVTEYLYDGLGQMRFAQDARQRAAGRYAYFKYDPLGRVIETGESNEGHGVAAAGLEGAGILLAGHVDDMAFPASGTDRVFTIYNVQAFSARPGQFPAPATYLDGSPQRFLRNRISHVRTEEDVQTVFSYDPHGNVEWFRQEIPGMEPVYLGYVYDLHTGNVREIRMNEGRSDAFYHRYDYDEDGRLLTVETSRDRVIWERDASYDYYAHGPLARLELGEDGVQGLDYVRTIHGWLKGINHPDLAANDPGGDGAPGAGQTAADAFGMALGYYDGDFVRAGSPFTNAATPLQQPLFDGNITGWSLGGARELGYAYTYDEVSRLISGQTFEGGGVWQSVPDYATAYSYDANGNLLGLRRDGAQGLGLAMDALSYTYDARTNRLGHVDDAVASAAYPDDLDDQDPGNYTYDDAGNLTADRAEGLTYTWHPNGKVKQVTKQDGTIVSYLYDGLGHRVRKEVKEPGQAAHSMYYVRDPGGQTLAIYEKEALLLATRPPILVSDPDVRISADTALVSRQPSTQNVIVDTSPLTVLGSLALVRDDLIALDFTAAPTLLPATQLSEITIAGNGRLGLYEGVVSESEPDTYTRRLKKRRYELADHLGNVRALIGDLKVPVLGSTASSARFEADVLGLQGYYPYGTPYPGQGDVTAQYRYGFNGKETDKAIAGSGQVYDFGARLYNARLGVWSTPDPLSEEYPGSSPYSSMGGNPVLRIDPDGQQHYPVPIYPAGSYGSSDNESSDGKDEEVGTQTTPDKGIQDVIDPMIEDGVIDTDENIELAHWMRGRGLINDKQYGQLLQSLVQTKADAEKQEIAQMGRFGPSISSDDGSGISLETYLRRQIALQEALRQPGPFSLIPAIMSIPGTGASRELIEVSIIAAAAGNTIINYSGRRTGTPLRVYERARAHVLSPALPSRPLDVPIRGEAVRMRGEAVKMTQHNLEVLTLIQRLRNYNFTGAVRDRGRATLERLEKADAPNAHE